MKSYHEIVSLLDLDKANKNKNILPAIVMNAPGTCVSTDARLCPPEQRGGEILIDSSNEKISVIYVSKSGKRYQIFSEKTAAIIETQEKIISGFQAQKDEP